MKPKLIPDWKQAWRYASVQLATLQLVLLGLEAQMPQIATMLPPHWTAYLSAAILVARVVKFAQDASKEAKDEAVHKDA